MAGSEHFYRDLPAAASFVEAGELQYYRRFPDDWTVVLGDIEASGKAIEAGRYKAVNMIGAAIIVAVLNACPDVDIPFVFGGDGAALVVPPTAREAAEGALLQLKAHAQSIFGLELRAGAVSVAALRAGGHDLSVLKLALSGQNHLAMFAGSGLTFADRWLKRAHRGDAIHLQPSGREAVPNLEGLSCRWQPLPSQNGTILTIISVGADPTLTGERQHFFAVTQGISRILGVPIDLASPVTDASLSFKWPPAGVDLETRATAGRLWRFHRRGQILLQSFIQYLVERSQGRIGYYDARKYRNDMRHNTDFQKYDGMLRLTLDVTIEQAASIDAFLNQEFRAGRLNYGISSARDALMTCVVFSLKDSRHVHFIDGAGGGLALAAHSLKAQIAANVSAWSGP